MNRILIIIAILITMGFGGYLVYKNYFNKNVFRISENTSQETSEIKENKLQVKLEEALDQGFFIQNKVTYDQDVSNEGEKPRQVKVTTNYKYYSYGTVPSGKYQGYSIFLVEHNEAIWNYYMGGITTAGKDEIYDYELIAAKDGKFISYKKYEDGFISERLNKGKYLGNEIFPLPNGFDKKIQVDELNTLSLNEPWSFLTLKSLKDNPRNNLTKLSTKIGGFDVYELKNTDTSSDGYKSITTMYLVDLNGLAVMVNPTVNDVNYHDGTVPAAALNLSNSKYKMYTYLKRPCASEILNLKETNPEIISKDNLEKVNTSGNFNVYKIKDLNLESNKKFIESFKDGYFYTNYEKLKINWETNPSVKDFSDNGVLVYIDSLGIYRALVQNDTLMGRGGCGKPVVYLYPEKDTKVTLSFVNPIQFTTVIPSYQNSWEVLAHSNGILKDLKPQLTDCNSFGNKIGSEYAKNACEKNEYPYLYWSGNTASNFYPQALTGFIVKKENLNSFFDEKLSHMNFNHKEINDFKEYWVSYLSNKDSEYFRISFFQNEIVNKLFPMNVNPKPQSQIRMFMDWDYATKDSNITEQKLINYPRTGFTLVEWGGLKK